jgi:DNA-binding beta-propeller fold protein YncE
VINSTTGEVTATIQSGGSPAEVAVSPDGLRAYVPISDSDKLRVLETASNITAEFPGGRKPRAVAVSPDGRRLYVANYDAASVSVIDTE